MASKLKTYLVGAYGNSNAGDDAFVEVVLDRLSKYKMPRKLVACSSVPLVTSHGIIKAHVTGRLFKGQHFIQRRLSTMHLDRILYAGGGIHTFAEELKRQRKVIERNPKAVCAAVGVSVGPFRDKASADECKRFLEKFSYVGVRGKESYNRLKEIDAQVNYEETFDIAVLLKTIGASEKPDRNVKSVGVSLLDQSKTYHPKLSISELAEADKRRIEMVSSVVNDLIREGRCDSVHLLDFCSHPRFSDYEIHERLKKKLSPEVPIVHHRYEDDPLGLFKKVRGLGYMFAMRLHAAIFAYTAEIPCMVIPYQDKNLEWTKTVGLAQEDILNLENFDHETCSARVGLLLKSLSGNASMPLDRAHEMAQKNWDGLKALNF